jgi:hypothetical protein
MYTRSSTAVRDLQPGRYAYELRILKDLEADRRSFEVQFSTGKSAVDPKMVALVDKLLTESSPAERELLHHAGIEYLPKDIQLQTQIGLPVFGYARICGAYTELCIDQINGFGANKAYRGPDRLSVGDRFGVEFKISAPARLKLEFPAYTGYIQLDSAEWVETQPDECTTRVSDPAVEHDSLLDAVSMGWLCVSKGIESPSFELRVLRDFNESIHVQISFVRIHEVKKSIWLRYAIADKETNVEVPAGGTGFSHGGYAQHALGSLYLEGPFKAGTTFPVTIESSDVITFGGSVLRGWDKDYRPAFELVRLQSGAAAAPSILSRLLK